MGSCVPCYMYVRANYMTLYSCCGWMGGQVGGYLEASGVSLVLLSNKYIAAIHSLLLVWKRSFYRLR